MTPDVLYKLLTMSTIERTERQRLVSTWLDVSLADELDRLAREADRSRSAELRIAIRQHIAETDNTEEQT